VIRNTVDLSGAPVYGTMRYAILAKHPDVAAQLAEQMTRWEAELAANPKGWKQ